VQQVTPHVFTSTEIRGCNPSYVVTSAGVVVIDTPQLPTKALEMRAEAESHGPIRFVINTEHHVDHIFGNYFFKGAGDVVHHQGVADNFMTVTPDLDPFAYALEAIPTDDPGAAPIVPDRDTYYEDPTPVTWSSPATSTCGSATRPSTSSTRRDTPRARWRSTCPRTGSSSPATRCSRSARPG
jgi:glyoxylase-like metal-dependent hydrolase (beta-lactamase superfamily II)